MGIKVVDVRLQSFLTITLWTELSDQLHVPVPLPPEMEEILTCYHKYFKIVAGSQKPLPRSPKLPASVWTLTYVQMKLAKYTFKQNITQISDRDHLLLWFQQIILLLNRLCAYGIWQILHHYSTAGASCGLEHLTQMLINRISIRVPGDNILEVPRFR
jgi:hypothetical protein